MVRLEKRNEIPMRESEIPGFCTGIFLLAFDLKQEIRAFIIDKFYAVCEAQILRFMPLDSLAIVRVRANMVPTKGG